jgi:tetratricopeptide (TPR) repeat protein
VLANVGYVPASPFNANDVDPTLTDIQNKALVKLGINFQDILLPLTKTQNQPSAQTDSRAAAYRLIADVASDDPAKRAWALNNAAEVYLRLDQYSEAENLGKRALNVAEEAELDNAIPKQQLRELRWNAALTVALASDKLGHKDEALKFCKMSIANGNGRGPYLVSSGSPNKRPSDSSTCVLQKNALLAH